MRRLPRRVETSVLIAVVAFAAFVRLRLADMPLERDEGEYAYAGQLILQGIPPYKLAYNMKLPGTYAAYATIMAVFGETARGIHFGLIVVNTLTILLVYLFGRSIFGVACGMVAAGVFAFLSLSPSALGLAAHATHFVTLFALGGTLCLWFYLQDRKRLLFCSGLLFGMSFVMKQQALFFPLFGCVLLAWDALAKDGFSARRLFFKLTVFSAGAVIPFAVTCLIMSVSGVFKNFWFWTFSYASQYASEISISQGSAAFRNQALLLFRAAPLLWIELVLASILILLTLTQDRKRLFLGLLLVASFATCCPGLFFRRHYFIPLLPALGLALGAVVEWGWEKLPQRAWSRPAILALLLLSGGQFLYREGFIFLQLSPEAACRTIYGPNPFPEAVRIGEYIRAHTKQGETIAVIGSEPEIYFYADRKSATGFIYTYPLVEAQDYASKMQQQMISEIEAAQPKILVVVNVSSSWLARDTADSTIFKWASTYSTAGMKPCLLVDIESSEKTSYYLDHDLPKEPRSKSYVWLYQRSSL